MAQEPRITTVACEAAEEANDRARLARSVFQRAWSDRRISEEEASEITLVLFGTEEATETAVTMTADVDEAIAVAIVDLRRGPSSYRAGELRRQRQMRLIRGTGGGDEPGPAGPGMAKRAA